jgi:hypothetical protein
MYILLALNHGLLFAGLLPPPLEAVSGKISESQCAAGQTMAWT